MGLPAISDLAHYSIDSCLDLSNRNILWTRVTSGGLSLPLPIDSCCSVSLVSGSHTDHLLASQPNLLFTPLSKKIPVSVANPNATLFATGTMQVPITFENGTNWNVLMLYVPGLAWPLMLGENHQITSKALVDHYALTITFRHPAINTTIQCEKGNPLHAFPSLVPPLTSTNSASSSSATATPITYFFNSSLFLQGNPDVHVISGPTSLRNTKSMLSPPLHATYLTQNVTQVGLYSTVTANQCYPRLHHTHTPFPVPNIPRPIHSKNYQLLIQLMFSSLPLRFTPLKIIPIYPLM